MALPPLAMLQTPAERVQCSLGTMAEVRAGRRNRHAAILLGAFVAFEFPQVFPELPVVWRIGSSVVLPLGITAVLRLLARRE